MIMVSKCLCGVNCKYNGGNNLNEGVKKISEDNNVICICPEEINLPTPRKPVEIRGGSAQDVLDGNAFVVTKDGDDCTKEFIDSAKKILEIAKSNNVTMAVLKAKSPSCGCGKIYDGTFTGNLIDGNGVTSQILINNGIKVISENDIDSI